MVEVPDSLHSLFSVTVEKTERRAAQRQHTQATTPPPEPGPPVEKGEVRDVTIESLVDQGGGIAKVERSYVVIVQTSRSKGFAGISIRYGR